MDFKGVELARTGTFHASTGPITLTGEDLDAMVDAYTQLKGKVDIPVKLGHDQDQKMLTDAGLPAAGWVENVRRIGDKLVGDLMRVPDEVSSLIRSGAYRKRSIEAIRNIQLAGKRWKFALTGLALLGSKLPAVDSLEDIAELYASGQVTAASSVFDSEATIVVIRADSGLLRADVEVINQPRAEDKEEDMDIEKLRTMLSLPETASEEEVLASLESRLATKQPDDQKSDESDKVQKLSAELAETQKKVIQLENERAKDVVTIKVDEAIKEGKFMPAARESLIKLAMHDMSSFDDLAKGTPANSVLSPERGSSQNEGLPDSVKPTESEVKIAASFGLTEEDLLKQKARDAGVKLPKSEEKKTKE